jgi:hypothetical protein
LGIPVATDDLMAVFHERWADLIADPDVLESRFVPAI